LQQLKDIIEETEKADQSANEVREQVDGEEIPNLDNTSSAFNTFPNTIHYTS
jgi:hypothetical protein